MRPDSARPVSAVVGAPFVQIEISTVCNFSCFYCAGRDMAQRHMESAVFEQILERLRGEGGLTVSLQGEGEPMLHPSFWDWVGQVKQHGWQATTISNGSRIDAERCAEHLQWIGISLDTLDPTEAERMGRPNLPKVLANLQSLKEAMGPERITVHTVFYGQPLEELVQFLKDQGIRRHVVQPLQVKDDYAKRYPQLAVLKPLKALAPAVTAYRCRFLEQPVMRVFNLDGVEMPCCFIKDISSYRSARSLVDSLAQGIVPRTCAGCRELR